MNFIALELKTNDAGGTGVDVLYSGIDERVAWQRYYTALSNAASSGRPCHAAMVVGSDGSFIASERFEVTEETE